MQTLPILNGPLFDAVTSKHIFKEKKRERGKKNQELCRMVKLLQEVEEAGLVNKHIFWRSAGGNELEGQGYEFMTVYDTIVSMGAESMPVPV